MERICRRPGHCIPEIGVLTSDIVSPEYVRDWARHVGDSPLYQHLALFIASDPELMAVLNQIEHPPKPNILFGGVHYLLLKGHDHELARFYPSITAGTPPVADPGPAFKNFVMANEDFLVEAGRTRYTQTNEARRSAVLLPMIWLSGYPRFHLVDVGTSAGLNLAIDRYSYRWGEFSYGTGAVLLSAEIRQGEPRIRRFEVLTRTGLDLNPIDPRSDDSRLWLRALVWPEQQERRERLTAALDELSQLDFRLIAGDAATTLPVALDRIPGDEPVVVMNSYVLIQMSDMQRTAIAEAITQAREKRPVFRVSMEVAAGVKEGVALLEVDDGTGLRAVGHAHHHGEWLELSA